MSDLSAAAEALGIPEAIVARSAEARAAETGSSVDEILAAWAGGGTVAPADVGPPTEPEAKSEPEPAAEPEAQPESAPEVTIEVPDREPATTAAVSRSPVPAEVTAAEASNLPVVVSVPTAGIKERTNFTVPKWLATMFFIVPLFALFALGSSATGECGSATELATDVITGEAVNCDGSKFEGSGVGGGSTDYIALGESIYMGNEVAAVNCSGCHGVGGGGGAGPALNGVLTVFGACPDHEEWVRLGTAGFQAAGRATYGDTNKPVGGFGVMPSFENQLTQEQLDAVTAFERVRFGGQDPAVALENCGLVEPPPEEGAPPEGQPGDGGQPPAGGTDTTTPADGGNA